MRRMLIGCFNVAGGFVSSSTMRTEGWTSWWSTSPSPSVPSCEWHPKNNQPQSSSQHANPCTNFRTVKRSNQVARPLLEAKAVMKSVLFNDFDRAECLIVGALHFVLCFVMPCYNLLGWSCAALCIILEPLLLSSVANLPHPYPLPSLCAVPYLCGSGWVLKGWRMVTTFRWTRLSPGAGPLRICTRTAAIRWCALRSNPSSGMYWPACACYALPRFKKMFAYVMTCIGLVQAAGQSQLNHLKYLMHCFETDQYTYIMFVNFFCWRTGTFQE